MDTNLYSIFFNESIDCFFVLEKNGTIFKVNDVCTRILGYSASELIGKSIHELEESGFQSEVSESIQELFKKGEHRFFSRFVTKTGSSLPVEVTTRSIEYQEKLYFISVVRDITTQIQIDTRLKKNEAKYRAVTETLLDGRSIGKSAGCERFLCESVGLFQGGTPPDESFRSGIQGKGRGDPGPY